MLETARGGILREGLGFDRCDVAVVTNIGEGDHLGLGRHQHARGAGQGEAHASSTSVAPDGTAVLNADDPLVAEMAAHCPGAVIFFALDGRSSGHRRSIARAGGRAVFVRDDADRPGRGRRARFRWSALDRVPLTHGGQIGFQVENTLAAVAAAWALGMPARR